MVGNFPKPLSVSALPNEVFQFSSIPETHQTTPELRMCNIGSRSRRVNNAAHCYNHRDRRNRCRIRTSISTRGIVNIQAFDDVEIAFSMMNDDSITDDGGRAVLLYQSRFPTEIGGPFLRAIRRATRLHRKHSVPCGPRKLAQS